MAGITKEELTYEAGKLYLGHTHGSEAGIKTERHAITVAGSRSGKGACVIIPNLLRWPNNVLVIDPKGENAEKTWEARKEMGKAVHIIDPFKEAKVPAEMLAAFNPLADIDPTALTAGSDLKVIADGLVKRADPKHAQWDDGAVKILAGVMAYVINEAPPDKRTLTAMREVLLQGRDDLYADAQRMMESEGCDGLAKNAGLSIMTGFETEKSIEADYLNNARSHTEWIDMVAFHNVLSHSTFDLSDIKTGNASVYLVLPPQYLDTHGAFLRLFVRCAINAMAKGGSGKGEKCLFILDEFYSLGKIEAIATASGLMPSYGVQLWPFLQDLGQLITLYGKEGSETFFANADLHQFFGNTDPLTLEQISARLGVKNSAEIPFPPAPPSSAPSAFGQGLSALSMSSQKGAVRAMGAATGGLISAVTNQAQAAEQADYQNRMNIYQRLMAEHGKPRMSPDEVAMKIRKKDDVVADGMVCFVFGSEPIWLSPAPYFRDLKPQEDGSELHLVSSNIFGWKMSNEEFVWSHLGRAIMFSGIGAILGVILAAAGVFPAPMEGVGGGIVWMNIIGFVIYRLMTGQWGQFGSK